MDGAVGWSMPGLFLVERFRLSPVLVFVAIAFLVVCRVAGLLVFWFGGLLCSWRSLLPLLLSIIITVLVLIIIIPAFGDLPIGMR